jgi:NAD-dependent SIR2 family protein deacetylase
MEENSGFRIQKMRLTNTIFFPGMQRKMCRSESAPRTSGIRTIPYYIRTHNHRRQKWVPISESSLGLCRNKQRALHSQPNVAHTILAKLSIPQLQKSIAPAAQSFHLIMQNVDRLSVITAANLSASLQAQNLTGPECCAPKGSLIQMHGKLFEVQCTQCEWRCEDLSDPLCPSLSEAEKNFSSIQDAGSMNLEIPVDSLPCCGDCQVLARPGVVWFLSSWWNKQFSFQIRHVSCHRDIFNGYIHPLTSDYICVTEVHYLGASSLGLCISGAASWRECRHF